MAGRSVPLRGVVVQLWALMLIVQLSRCMYFVVMAWFALELAGDIAAVGRVLVWTSLLNLIVGPFLGTVVDRFRRRALFMAGEGLRMAAVAGLALYAWLLSAALAELPALYLTAAVVACGSLLSVPAIQGLIQLAAGSEVTRVLSLGVAAAQLGNAAGAALGGLAIVCLGIERALGLCAFLSLLALCVCAPLRLEGAPVPPERPFHYGKELLLGVQALWARPALLLTCLTIALAWSASQASTVLLPAFARLDLGLGANAYGWIDAMWALWGMAGGVLLGVTARPLIERFLRQWGLLLLAGATAGFALSQSLGQALLLHGAMGLVFVLCCTASDAWVLKQVERHMIGRIRNNIQALIGLLGIAIYLGPGVLAGLSPRLLYLGFAALLAMAGVTLFIAQAALSRQPGPAAAQCSQARDPQVSTTPGTPSAAAPALEAIPAAVDQRWAQRRGHSPPSGPCG